MLNLLLALHVNHARNHESNDCHDHDDDDPHRRLVLLDDSFCDSFDYGNLDLDDLRPIVRVQIRC